MIVRIAFLGLVLASIRIFSLEQIIQTCPYIFQNYSSQVERSITVTYHFENKSDLLDASYSDMHVRHHAQKNHICRPTILATLAKSRLIVDNVYITPCADLRNTTDFKSTYRGTVWLPANQSELSRFSLMFQDRRVLFIGDSIMSGYYRTYKHMLIHVCSSDFNIDYGPNGQDIRNDQDESVHCARLNASAIYLRSIMFGGVDFKRHKFEGTNLTTHILLEDFVWFFLNINETKPEFKPEMPGFIDYLHRLILLCKSFLPMAKIIVLGTPGIAGDHNLGYMGKTSYRYIELEANIQFYEYARSEGLQFINAHTLMIEQFTNLKDSIESNLNYNNMYVDNYHPCVPWVDIPALTIFLTTSRM